MGMIANLILAWKNRDKLKVVATEAKTIQEAIKSTPKSGYLSSEFLTTVLGAAALIYNTLAPQHPIDPKLSAELATSLAALYVVARTSLKAAHSLVDTVKALVQALHATPTVISSPTTTIPPNA